MGKVLVGAFLPAGAPDELVVEGQATQVVAGDGRKVVQDAVDRKERAGWTFVRCKAEQRDHPVHVHQEQRFCSICRHFQVTIVTRHPGSSLASLPRSAWGVKREAGETDSTDIGFVAGPGETTLIP